MTAQPGRKLLTYDDYAKLPDDGRRYELYEGELIELSPSPNRAHQRAVLNLLLILAPHVRQHHLGEVFVAPYDVLLSNITVFQPDLVFVSAQNQDVNLPEHIRGAPDLVVEVLSPSTARRDRGRKMELYARHSVPYYWQFDPRARTAVADQLDEGQYREVARAAGGEIFPAPPFDDLQIPLSAIWE